jgi:hypothetical protein
VSLSKRRNGTMSTLELAKGKGNDTALKIAKNITKRAWKNSPKV